MEEEVRAEVRARRARSIQATEKWLELQALANTEEETPRESSGGAEVESVSPLVSEGPGVSSSASGGPDPGPRGGSVVPGQRLMSAFLVRSSAPEGDLECMKSRERC